MVKLRCSVLIYSDFLYLLSLQETAGQHRKLQWQRGELRCQKQHRCLPVLFWGSRPCMDKSPKQKEEKQICLCSPWKQPRKYCLWQWRLDTAVEFKILEYLQVEGSRGHLSLRSTMFLMSAEDRAELTLMLGIPNIQECLVSNVSTLRYFNNIANCTSTYTLFLLIRRKYME